MLIGVPAETKDQEHRVGLAPAGARELVARGHGVLVQAGAGVAIGWRRRRRTSMTQPTIASAVNR